MIALYDPLWPYQGALAAPRTWFLGGNRGGWVLGSVGRAARSLVWRDCQWWRVWPTSPIPPIPTSRELGPPCWPLGLRSWSGSPYSDVSLGGLLGPLDPPPLENLYGGQEAWGGGLRLEIAKYGVFLILRQKSVESVWGGALCYRMCGGALALWDVRVYLLAILVETRAERIFGGLGGPVVRSVEW